MVKQLNTSIRTRKSGKKYVYENSVAGVLLIPTEESLQVLRQLLLNKAVQRGENITNIHPPLA